MLLNSLLIIADEVALLVSAPLLPATPNGKVATDLKGPATEGTGVVGGVGDGEGLG